MLNADAIQYEVNLDCLARIYQANVNRSQNR